MKMKRKLLFPALAFAAALGFSGAANALLFDRGGGLIYDSVLDITWLQDANYAQTSGYDADGLMSWFTATTWAANLSYYDSVRDVYWDDWRLPTVAPRGASFNYNFSNNATTDLGYAKTTTDGNDGGWRDSAGNPVSEMGHMYYVNLGNKGFCTPNDASPGSCDEQSGWGLQNTSPFINLRPGVYWSGTEYAPNPNGAWDFNANVGGQGPGFKGNAYYAWAVRPGDVAAVPEPASIALVGLGLVGLGWMRRRRG